MLIDLAGKTALGTGSTQGIGAAIATGLARAGARTAVNGRTEDSVAAALERLREASPGADFVAAPGDISTDDGTRQVLDALSAVDILVNNLGIFGARPALDISDDEWRRYSR